MGPANASAIKKGARLQDLGGNGTLLLFPGYNHAFRSSFTLDAMVGGFAVKGKRWTPAAFSKTSRVLVCSALWCTLVIFMCNSTAALGVHLGGFW